MGATSVTGKGMGESHGLYKPENSVGCCGGKPPEQPEVTPTPKRGCVTRIKTGGILVYRSGNSSKIKVC